MSDKNARKELTAQYKEREQIGGVYTITNTVTGKLLLKIAQDIKGSENRFNFAKQTNNCTELPLTKDWAQHGANSFVYEVKETLKKQPAQSTKEFKADLELLKEIWLDKLSGEEWY
ncbi:hypothetical protein AGMMS50284_2580 [Clostridia bacterium]|nr:hypothetical protein AGMMS50284_2470 [Clostridia bacterium]GHU81838.1 hypothetical protein AGMMS50284_2580 [Clostridia bacterium]